MSSGWKCVEARMSLLPSTNVGLRRPKTRQGTRGRYLMPATRGKGGLKTHATRWMAGTATVLSAVAVFVLVLYVDTYKKYVKTAKIKRDLGLPLYQKQASIEELHYVPGSETDRIRSCGGTGNSRRMTVHMVHTATTSHGSGDLPARYACAVEAAAATGAEVVIHSTTLEPHHRPEDVLWPLPPPMQAAPGSRRVETEAAQSVRLEHVDLDSIFRALPLQRWYEREIAAVSSRFRRASQTADLTSNES